MKVTVEHDRKMVLTNSQQLQLSVQVVYKIKSDNVGKVHEPIHLASFGRLMASGEQKSIFTNVMSPGWSTKFCGQSHTNEYMKSSKRSKLVVKNKQKDMR